MFLCYSQTAKSLSSVRCFLPSVTITRITLFEWMSPNVFTYFALEAANCYETIYYLLQMYNSPRKCDSTFRNRRFCLFVKKQMDSRWLQAPWPFYSGKLSCGQLFFFFFLSKAGQPLPPPVTTTVRPERTGQNRYCERVWRWGKGAQQCFNVKMCKKDKRNLKLF